MQSDYHQLRNISFNDVNVSGEVFRRAKLNFTRLEGPEYRIPDVFPNKDGDTNGWPGDFEGRTILALSLLAQVVREEPKYLAKILKLLPSYFNASGFMGNILTDCTFNEQQFSGHSWLLRGLLEYYKWTHNERMLDLAKGIVVNLFLPAKDAYATYPLKLEERVIGGKEGGNLTGDVYGGWHPSTDIGCAFIPLDGLSQAYEILGDPRIKNLLDAMIEKFLEIDLVATKFQTHATLTALRGLHRCYKITKDNTLLEAIKKRYALYIAEATTENYENFNWFTRPEWTEPCAVIDSFIVAVSLWESTSDPQYLEDAHHIFFNAMGYEQRPTGGWGCNTCSGAKDEFINPSAYEATWCCLMRGGEGLSRAAEYLYWNDDSNLIIPFYNNSTAKFSFPDGSIILEQVTDYPTGGNVKLKVINSSLKKTKTIRLFIPSWMQDNTQINYNGSKTAYTFSGGFAAVNLQLKTGDVLELYVELGLRTADTINKNNMHGYHTFRHGPLILGIKNAKEAITIPQNAGIVPTGHAAYSIDGTDYKLTPINDMIDMPYEDSKTDRRQILFR